MRKEDGQLHDNAPTLQCDTVYLRSDNYSSGESLPELTVVSVVPFSNSVPGSAEAFLLRVSPQTLTRRIATSAKHACTKENVQKTD